MGSLRVPLHPVDRAVGRDEALAFPQERVARAARVAAEYVPLGEFPCETLTVRNDLAGYD